MKDLEKVKILETPRLILRELEADDAAFILELLNTPKFLQFIGDRGVRTVEEAASFIEDRYRQSYRDHGFGLYAVGLKSDGKLIGLCGFVRRDTLPGPDIGFAFLPAFEGQGFGFESASATINYGRNVLGFSTVLAITSTDNDASGRLLEKIGLTFLRLIDSGEETLKLYSSFS